MRKLVIILAQLTAALFLNAQQKPHYTQYILNNFILNPAISGIENYTDIKLSYRNQWTGLNGAPQTFYASTHGPLGKQDYRTTATSFEVPGENPRGRSYWENYTAAEPHHGIGAIFINDRTGFISRSSMFVSYAYHLGVSPSTSLAGGFMGGATAIHLDQNKIDWASLDPNDPAVGVAKGVIRKWQPELGAGLWLYSADYVAGISVQNIVPKKISFAKDYGDYLKPHFFAVLGYRFFLNDDINCLPSVTAKYVSPLQPQYDLNVKLQYHDLFWLGASYRTSDLFGGWSAMAGFNVRNTFNISYSFDAATANKMRPVSYGSHELMLGFLLGNRFGDTCPRNVW